jgi:hypothetical protein
MGRISAIVSRRSQLRRRRFIAPTCLCVVAHIGSRWSPVPSVIAIVGSVDSPRADELGLVGLPAAKGACEALGRALADADCDIVVYSSAPGFVEAHVVRGYVSSGKARARSIQVRYPEEDECSFSEMQQHDALFYVRPDVSPAWEVSFYRSLFDVDGVLLIGGGQSTLIAGLIAISARTPIVAISTFGGKAREVRNALARAGNDTTQEELEAMGRAWAPGVETVLVSALVEQRQRREARQAAALRADESEARHRRYSLAVAALALITAIACIIMVYKTRPGSTLSLAALLVGPLFVGVSGAIIRTVLDDGSQWLTTALLGLSAGAIASLLFVATQLATTPDALEGEGVKTLVVIEFVIGFVAGMTFDAVFKKLREQDVVDTAALERR